MQFELDSLTEYTSEAIIKEMRRVAALHRGGPFSMASFSRLKPKVSRDTVLRRFGTWQKALDAAGLSQLNIQPYSGTRYSDEQCFENLATVWTHHGRQPQHREMKNFPSCVWPKAYVMRWGTWRKSLKAFVDWANTEESPTTIDADASNISSRGSGVAQIVRREEDCPEVRPGLRFKVFMRDHFRCVACGRSPATHLNVELHADHVISVYDGGKTGYENLQTLCQDCNLGKGRTSMR